VSDLDQTTFHLAKQGYGSLRELRDLDTPEFLDLVEFENINSQIESYMMTRGAKNGRSH
jgi:hypothetical protein